VYNTQINNLELTAWSLIIPFIVEQQNYGSLMPLSRLQNHGLLGTKSRMSDD
jgi:hypothetical protein